MDDLVFDVDFSLLLGPLEVQLLLVILLLIQLHLLVSDPAGEGLDLLLHIGQLVLCDLKISLRTQTHVCHLIETSLVLLFDLTDLLLSIFSDLLHRFLIISLHRFNVVSKVRDLLILLSDGILMILLFLVDLLGVLFVDRSLCISELSSLLLLLLL